ncbi:putative iron dependent transcriptional repressor FeoA [Nakamurella endophytica]|uniref:Manganese transport regulator n=1 Tax=Nakamurella endophytica TaxID=1748367 RepID=A0A917SX55_9ACTN|nr:metal-dependent transcriptional regulator [Nakamurella endophytica]GGM02425.1 putative iron dependent transcriptional repressor FeoA [Nakamurella endophytica]
MARTGQTAAVENYLKTIWAVGEHDGGPVSATALAERLGLAASSVSGMLRRLTELGLVEHVRYGAVGLTPAGRAEALQVVRRHRLVEMYLVAELGYGWDEVHDEAEELEHVVSDLLVERIDARLGHPVTDPHGDPIPGPDGTVQAVPARRLSDLAAGEGGPLVRVDDRDPEVLRHLSAAGIALGQSVRLVERLPFGGAFVVTADGARHELAPGLAAAVWIGAAEVAR